MAVTICSLLILSNLVTSLAISNSVIFIFISFYLMPDAHIIITKINVFFVWFLHLLVLKFVVLHSVVRFRFMFLICGREIHEMNSRDGPRAWFSHEEIKRKISGLITVRKPRRCRARRPIAVYLQGVFGSKSRSDFQSPGLTSVVLRSPGSRVVIIFSVVPGAGENTARKVSWGSRNHQIPINGSLSLPFGPGELTHVKRCTCRVPPRAH